MKAKVTTETTNSSMRILIKQKSQVTIKGKPMAGCSFEELKGEAEERQIDPKNKSIQDLKNEIQKDENKKREDNKQQHGVVVKKKFEDKSKELEEEVNDEVENESGHEDGKSLPEKKEQPEKEKKESRSDNKYKLGQSLLKEKKLSIKEIAKKLDTNIAYIYKMQRELK